MNLILVGLSHKTAPIEVREKIAFPEEQIHTALRQLKTECELEEGMIVSTCNRVEVLAQGNGSQPRMIEQVKGFLHHYHGLRAPYLDQYLYSYLQHDLIRHVFRVASSLDSMVLGEPQILAQVKQAYVLACETNSAGIHLKKLLPRAFFVAKKVRTSTRIGASAVSVSSVALELARKIFGDLTGKTVLLLGAGKMSELGARSLVNSGIGDFFVANRTPQKSEELAERFSGQAIPLAELDPYLIRSDIVLVSTSSKEFLLDYSRLDGIVKKRRYRPLFIIDIAVPRNVDPAANELENVFVYDIDDLQSVIDANLRQRTLEAEIAEEIVAEEVDKFTQRLGTQAVGPLIDELRTRLEEICLQELVNRRNALSPEEFERTHKALKSAAHRIAHPLILQLRQSEDHPSRHLHKMELIRKIFKLTEEK